MTIFLLIYPSCKCNCHLPTRFIAAGMTVKVTFHICSFLQCLICLFNLCLCNISALRFLRLIGAHEIFDLQSTVKFLILFIHTLFCRIGTPLLPAVTFYLMHNIIHNKTLTVLSSRRPPVASILTIEHIKYCWKCILILLQISI